MNITDITDPEKIPEDIWKAIFNKQKQLALKYQKIENMGSLLKTTKTNIDTAFGQKWIKDFAWRVTEELAEAEEVCSINHVHYHEELIDALHFLTELTIIVGYDQSLLETPKIIKFSPATPWDVVYNLGLMCNTLKNKPWKQTQMLTDRIKFERYLRKAWEKLRLIFFQNNLSHEDIYKLYFKKQMVNHFRIRSKY